MTVAFCGEFQNATSITQTGALSNECFLDGLSFMPHILFVLITLPILISWNKSYYGSMHVKSWIHFPGHDLRFTLFILMVLLNLLEIGEGVISNSLYQGTHLHLFLPHCVALIGTVTAAIYYHYLEQWNSPRFLLLLIVYWTAVLTTKILELLYQMGRGHGSDFMRFDLNCTSISICICFLLVDFYVFLKLRYALFPTPKKLRPPPELEHTFYVHEYVNLLSKFTFAWVTKLLVNGYKHPLEKKELGNLPPCETSVTNFLHLHRVVTEQRKKSAEQGKAFSLWWCYWRAFGGPLVVAGIFMFVGHMLAFVGPLCITKLIEFVERTNAERLEQVDALPEEEQYVDVWTYVNHGYILCLVLFLSTVVQNSALQMHHYIVIRQGIRLRSALQVEMYRKSLHLTTEPKSGGQSANLISVDVYNAMMAFYMGHYSWVLPLKALISYKALHLAAVTNTRATSPGSMINHITVDARNVMMLVYAMCFSIGMPIQVSIAVYLLYRQLGYSALIACTALLAMCPLQYLLSKFFAIVQKKTMSCSDERLRIISEIFSAIKLIKLCAWEKLLRGRVEKVRAKQIKLLFKGSCLSALTGFVTHGTPMLITLLAFSLFPYLQDSPLTAARAFTAIALFDILKTPLNLFPIMINMMVNAYISTQRLQKFLASPEVHSCTPLPQEPKELTVEISLHSAEPEVKVVNGTHSRPVSSHKDIPTIVKPRKRNAASCSEYEESEKMLKVNEEPSRPRSVGNLLTIGTEKILSDRERKDDYVHSDLDVRPRSMSNVGSRRRSHLSDVCIKEEDEADTLVEVTNASFSWDWEKKVPDMEDVNLEIKRGDVAMVIGTVGSGKSSLISALLGEMCCTSGTLSWAANINKAYAGQTPWLRNDSVQNNILFGAPMDKKLYRRVIHACALNPDIGILPAGDQTEIGEKGINLSGGQKQRIALARALYTKADVVIMDDPFSALDAHVGAHIFESGIVRMLMKKKCTIIMATNNLQYLSYAHTIITLSENKVSKMDNLQHLKECHPDLYEIHHMSVNKDRSDEGNDDDEDPEADIDKERRLVQHHISSREFQRRMSTSQLELDVVSVRRDSVTSTSPRQIYMGHFENFSHDEIHTPEQVEERRVSHYEVETATSSDNTTPEEQNKGVVEKASEAGRLIEDEERKEGAVSFSVYWAYIKACSVLLSIIVILLHLAHTGATMATDFWLSDWSSSGSDISISGTNTTSNNTQIGRDEEKLDYYIKGYIGLGVSTVILALFVVFGCELAGLLASIRFHNKMLKTILYAPMRFFDTTPIGRILNRFSGDTFIIDSKLASTIGGLFRTTLLCVSAMLVNAIAAPYFLLVAVPIVLIYFFLQKFFRSSSRELARLDSISKSPIISHFTETLGGITTIRAFGDAERFQKIVLKLIDSNATIFLWLNTCNRWLGVRLDHLGAAVVFSASVCTVTMACHGYISSGMVGLGIAYALMMAHYLNWVIRMLTDAEMQMNAIERVVHYTELDTEDAQGGRITVPQAWPSKGNIAFENVALRYAANLEPAVRNVNLKIKAGSKVGICGRTGSGKSSLTLGLFRLNDISEGRIIVDGVDISQVPLETLRSRLSIIPQDPILFSGTIRYNLDPEGENTDADIWRALEIGQLKSTIEQLDGQLGSLVEEGGSNFSVGQRQLFCLARAFLRASRILVMDEATASVDLGTDRQVQDVIHESFRERTVLTIAHRVSTITDYDEIVVLEQGRIVEHDTPQNLMAKQDSRFYSLVKSNK